MSTQKLGNNKYQHGKYKTKNEHKGWFVGAFLKKNNPCKTDKIEIVYREHKPGETSKPHYHKQKN